MIYIVIHGRNFEDSLKDVGSAISIHNEDLANLEKLSAAITESLRHFNNHCAVHQLLHVRPESIFLTRHEGE